MTLVILAGGFGTRFGGPKQFMSVGPEGECLLHYAIADAWAAGFRDFVLLTREELADSAREAVYPKLSPEFRPRMVFQETPGGKPRGTGHAVLSCRGQLAGCFAACNADDYYGPRTYAIAAGLLDGELGGSSGAVMVPFEVQNTLSENGGGSRGMVEGAGGTVQRLTELRDVQRHQNGSIWGRSEEGMEVELAEGTPVSMNMFGFDDSIFELLEDYTAYIDHDFLGREIGLPQFLNREIALGQTSLTFETTPERWFGLTFPDDLDEVKQKLAKRGPAF